MMYRRNAIIHISVYFCSVLAQKSAGIIGIDVRQIINLTKSLPEICKTARDWTNAARM